MAKLHVVATWLDEQGDRTVMRSDGVVMHWSAAAGEWLFSSHLNEPTRPAPGCVPRDPRGGEMTTEQFRREYPGTETADDSQGIADAGRARQARDSVKLSEIGESLLGGAIVAEYGLEPNND